jgi:hypothetical protein
MIQGFSVIAHDIGLDMDVSCRSDRDADIVIATNTAGRSGERERVGVVQCDTTLCEFPGRISDYLEQTRQVPILIDGVIRFS